MRLLLPHAGAPLTVVGAPRAEAENIVVSVRRLLLLAAALCACSGPPAPDAALCRDVVSRLCLGPICSAVDVKLAPQDSCAADLTARAGCDDDELTLAAPLDRNRFLECRIPLLRNGTSQLAHPGCDNVAEALGACPDLVRFFGGTP